MNVKIDIQFVRAQTGDWHIIQSIAHRTWPAAYGNSINSSQLEYLLNRIYSESALKEQMERMNHIFTLIYYKGSPVGFVSIEENYLSIEKLMIHKLYVLPEFQGQGIGKAILNHIGSTAHQAGRHTLRLKVFHKNNKAIFFYRHLGFLIRGEEETNFENGYQILDYVMEKKIFD